jgi:hypothetical protein
MSKEEGYGLVIEFPDQAPSFAYGFEAGQVYALMMEKVSRIKRTINDENVDLISQMAARCEYSVKFNHAADGWAEMVADTLNPEPEH